MALEPSGVSISSPKIRDEALVRRFVSQNGNGYIAIGIYNGSDAVDPDAGTLSVTVWFNDPTAVQGSNPYGTAIVTVTADSITKDETGKYHYDLGPEYTQSRGLLTAIWTYSVNGVAFQFIDHLQVLSPMPLYDTLTDAEKVVVDQVSWMFGDMYDSTEGGPHLIEEFQSHWNFERIAQMQRIAVQKMNFIGNFGNPPTNWSIGTGASVTTTPGQQVTTTQTLPDGSSTTVTYTTNSSSYSDSGVPAQFSGLAIWGTYIECLRHFRDSYTEIPDRSGMDVTYVNRQQYWQRWSQNLQSEEADYKQALKAAKMSMLSLSKGSLLVAGGIYGSSSGIFFSGMYAAQTRAFRFYPAAPAISFGSRV